MSSSSGADQQFHQVAGLFWPQGDPRMLREARHAWEQHAADVAGVRQVAEGVVRGLLSGSQGPAMDAVAGYWRRWEEPGGYFEVATSSSRALAHGLERYAQEIDDARAEITHIAEAAAAVVAVGIVLTVVTAGVSDVAAGAAAEGLVAAAARVALQLLTAVRTIVVMVLRNAALGALEALTIDTAVQVVRVEVLHVQAGFGATELWHAGEAGAAAGAVAPGLGGAVARLGGRLAPRLAEELPALTRLPGWAPRVGAGAVVGGGTNAIADQVTTGHVDLADVALGVVVGGVAGTTARGAPGGARGLTLSEKMGLLRTTATRKGNFGMGSMTRAEADELGRAWVGDGCRVASDGKTLVSSDGRYTYRPPSYKPRLGRYQANFEWKQPDLTSRPLGNGHVDITDPR
jgi:hypothetical protein